VYISAGSSGNRQQEDFVIAMQSYLAAQGLAPRTVGRNYFKNQQPLQAVAECMRECAGVGIVAFERVYVEKGIERRDSPQQVGLSDVKIPTIWNHIEGAIAYTLSLPLLVLAEKDLRIKGLLEGGYDWYVQRITLDQSVFSSPEFVGIFNDWKERCSSHTLALRDQNQRKPFDPVGMSVGQLLSALRPGQLWAALVALSGALVGIATLAFKLGGIAKGH
jgi:hypothetical protein